MIDRAGQGIVRAGIALALLLCGAPAHGDDEFKNEEGFVSLFNGHDLSGWRLGRQPLDGVVETDDQRFAAQDGVIRIQGGKPNEDLYTEREFSRDFVLRLEFRAHPMANSGLHIRGKQLQVRDYPTVGPYKDLKSFKPGGWNAIEVTVKAATDGRPAVAACTCNGEVLESALVVPATGGIGVQSETNQIEYRRIRIREMP